MTKYPSGLGEKCCRNVLKQIVKGQWRISFLQAHPSAL